MFNNLVECAKTKKDNKRTVYFAITSTVWTLALAGSIIGGIFLYDAKLDEQLSVLSMLVAPPPPPPPPPASTVSRPQPSQPTTSNVPTAVKLERIETAPEIKSKPASPSLVKVSDGGLEGVDGGVDGGTIGGTIGGAIGGVIGGQPTSEAEPPPPPKPEPTVTEPKPEPKPSLVRRSEGVLRGSAVTQVKPEYPALARQTNISGDVQIDILIGEDGSVTSAKVLGGHPILQQAALKAAKQWKFNPTLLNGSPVKVQGVLTFRFTL